MVKDPVCGMEVDSDTAKFKAEKDGETFYFCSKHCYDSFTGKTEKHHAETSHGSEKCTINIDGMHCASCVSTIENALKKNKGVKNASVNLASQKA
ncbi:MAG: YHS domain-containing protein, partial [Nanoarchaeota archaeon]|nr:YHS domain-containing protein [Nanoarchaeota archaeon]